MVATPRDENRVPALLGTSSTDGSSLVPIYANDSTNRLMVDSSVTAAINPLSEVSLGNTTGRFTVNKFGNAPDFDTGDGEVTIWDGAEDGTAWENMVYDYSATADIDSMSSSNVNDTSLNMEITGLDTNYDLVTQTIATDASDGRTRVALTTNLIRVFRVKNVSASNLQGHVVVYPNTALTSGVPSNKAFIRAVVDPNNNQTEMAIYTVPDGYTALLHRMYANTAGATRSAEYLIKLKARPFGQVFQLKQKAVIADGNQISLDREFSLPIAFSAKTDIEMTAQILTTSVTDANLIAGFDLELVAN